MLHPIGLRYKGKGRGAGKKGDRGQFEMLLICWRYEQSSSFIQLRQQTVKEG